MTLTFQVHGPLRQHAILEEFDVPVRVARHDAVLSRGRLVVLHLPRTEHLQGLVCYELVGQLEFAKMIY